MGSSNAYKCLFALHKLLIFGPILLIMLVGGFENGEIYAYVIKACPLIELEFSDQYTMFIQGTSIGKKI